MTPLSPLPQAFALNVVVDLEDLEDSRRAGLDARRRSPQGRGCQFCGLSEADHGTQLIHRFVDPDPAAAKDPYRSCNFTPSASRSGFMSRDGRAMPGRTAITTYLSALHAGDSAQQGLRGGLAELPTLLSGCEYATVTIGARVASSQIIAVDPTSRRSEELQHTLDEGATLHALRTGYSIFCHDLRAEHRWPRWRDQVTKELGLGAALSVPLRDQQRVIGALTLYSSTAGGLSDTDIALLHTLALPLARTLIEARLAPLMNPSNPVAEVATQIRRDVSNLSAVA